MKKLIAISVVFALVAGVAFAVDVGGTVISGVTLISGDTGDDSDVMAGGAMKRMRFEGAGEAGDGNFGGWLRLGDGGSPGFNGLAWWKPLDQFKLTFGANPDGHWGKEGVTGWMFYQMPYDTGVTMDGANVWGGDNIYGQGLKYRNAFFRGVGDPGALLEIKPMDMLGINIAIPFIAKGEGKAEDIFKATVAQLDLNLDFGNIALTYEGEASYIQGGNKGGDGGTVFVYFGGSFGDLSLDVGLGYQLTGEDENTNPISAGLGVKYAADAFGVKVRVVGSFGGDDKNTNVLADIMPFFNLSDTMRAFVSVGIGMTQPEEGDSTMGWHFNPFLQVGNEWGPAFYAGVKVSSAGGDDAVINWAIPLAIGVSF